MAGVVSFPIHSWNGPVEAEEQAAAVAALEAGNVLHFPELPFEVSAEERRVLAGNTADGSSKNVSYDPVTKSCKHTALSGPEAALLEATMARYADQALALIGSLFPGYLRGLERARTSFRPTEVEGRKQAWRQDDTRLHLDAFPTRPLAGRRILRVFANIDPDGTRRRWLVGEDFESHAARFLPKVRAALPGEAALLRMFGLTKALRSPYDHIMLQLHDAAKRDAGYQAEVRAREAPVEFAPNTTWMVYTDQTPHAALAGRNAFEQTFHLDPAAMADPATSPVKVLERLSGRALV